MSPRVAGKVPPTRPHEVFPAHLAGNAVVCECLRKVGVAMKEHKAPSKVGDKQSTAFMDELKDRGRLPFAKLRRDENVALAKFRRRFYPTGV